ncbi:hypothetical protein NKG37_13260 [Niallia sp. RD1]|nr:hypothetical protein [Niallia sp. RD1]UTI44593.1 hypothetical protein NKG37_13260 [Niallia sp. RD1]
MLPLTPIEVIVITLMVIIGYIVYLGIEILGRTTEIFILLIKKIKRKDKAKLHENP